MTRGGLLAALLLAGRIAEALAGPDPDVEASVAAYEAGDYETAAERLDRAIERRGERPELLLNRGLLAMARGDVEAARADFERATESEHANVRASAHYELGNLAFDAEDWDGAIAAYIECLKLRPDHDNAKWNLELALERKREQEEQQKQQQEQQEQQEQQGGGEQQDKEQQQEGGEEQEQQGGEDQQEQQEGGGADREQQGGEEQEQQQGGGEEQQGEEQQQGGGQDQQEQQGAEDRSDGSSAPQPSGAARPIDRADIDRALEELDREDPFVLGRPSGRRRKVEKDW